MRIGTQGRTPRRAADPQDGADARWLADAVLLVLGMFGVHRFRRGQVPTAMATLGLTLVGLWTLPDGVVGIVPLGAAALWSMLDMIRDPGFREARPWMRDAGFTISTLAATERTPASPPFRTGHAGHPSDTVKAVRLALKRCRQTRASAWICRVV